MGYEPDYSNGKHTSYFKGLSTRVADLPRDKEGNILPSPHAMRYHRAQAEEALSDNVVYLPPMSARKLG